MTIICPLGWVDFQLMGHSWIQDVFGFNFLLSAEGGLKQSDAEKILEH